MLIIEGTDLVGKTQLAKKLVQMTSLSSEGYVYKHFTRLPYGFHYFWDYVSNAVPCSVQDRFHMSEIVYSKARKEKSPLTPFLYEMVDGYLSCMLCSFTYVITVDANLLQRRFEDPHRKYPEMYGLGEILTANEAFLEIVANNQMTGITDFYRSINIDGHIHLTEKQPWVNDVDIANLLSAYQRKQAQFHAVAQHPKRFLTILNRLLG